MTVLPRLAVLTDRRQATGPLVEVVEAAVRGGARLVVLREKDLPDAARAALAAQLGEVLAAVGGRLVLAGHPPAGGHASAGVHLAASDPWPQRPVGLVGRSCHSPAEVAAAAAHGAHYATLSPIFPSRSKPGYGPPLGPAVFAASGSAASGSAARSIPVYALGGVEDPQRVYECVAAGAAGVAVMGAVMRSADPAMTVARLIAAVEAVESVEPVGERV